MFLGLEPAVSPVLSSASSFLVPAHARLDGDCGGGLGKRHGWLRFGLWFRLRFGLRFGLPVPVSVPLLARAGLPDVGAHGGDRAAPSPAWGALQAGLGTVDHGREEDGGDQDDGLHGWRVVQQDGEGWRG